MKHQLKRKEGGGGDHCWQRTQSVQGKRRAGFGGAGMKKKATVTEVGEKEGKWEKIRVVRLARVECARHRQS